MSLHSSHPDKVQTEIERLTVLSFPGGFSSSLVGQRHVTQRRTCTEYKTHEY